jgi:hypothetical protein
VTDPSWNGVLLAGTAVFASAVAAWTANHRMERQLTHDREMRDRDALRQMLDDALRVIGDGINLVAESIEQRHKGHGLEGPAKANWLAALSADTSQLRQRSTQIVLGAQGELERLRLRFGMGHEVVKCYAKIKEELTSALDGEFARRRTAETTTGESMRTSLGEKTEEFIKLCRPYVGVEESAQA